MAKPSKGLGSFYFQISSSEFVPNKMINLNQKSPELAEFIGILIGDGFIGSYGRTTKMIQITGHKLNDREYYENYLVPLVNTIFGINPHLYERPNCLRLTIYSKAIFEYLRDTFNFPVGKKEEIEIPKNFLETKESKLRTIRGLFDTDGTIHLQRQKYPVIAITTTSRKLAFQVQKILNEFDFGAYMCQSKSKECKDAYRVTIFGKQKVLKWKQLIGSSNPYHQRRINASVA